MSTFAPDNASLPRLEDVRVAIVTAEWNGHITGALRDGAVNTLKEYGLKDEDVACYDVPGAAVSYTHLTLPTKA